MRNKTWIMIPIFLGTLLLSRAYGGWIVKSETIRPGLLPLKSTTYYGEGKFAEETPFGTTIIDFTHGVIIQVNPWQRAYSKTTVEEMARLIKKAQARFKEQLEKLPPKKRAHVEKMIGVTSHPPKITIEDMGEETLLGHKCKVYQIDLDGKKTVRLWIARDLMPYPPKVEKRFRETVEKAYPSADKELGIFRLERTPEFKKLTEKGLVMKMVDYRSNSITRVTEMEEKTIPPSKFSPPPGFREVPLEQLKQPQSR